MRIHSIRVRNYRALRDVALADIPSLAVFVGANGTGKRTFVDIFRFLKDCLRDDVRAAVWKRGGFERLLSRDAGDRVIEIALQVEMDSESTQMKRLVAYELEVMETTGRQISVAKESLQYKRSPDGTPCSVFRFKHGRGEALSASPDVPGWSMPLESPVSGTWELRAPFVLALNGLGQFKQFETASRFREWIENWELNDLCFERPREEPDVSPAQHLRSNGENIAHHAKYLREEHPAAFEALENDLLATFPGVRQVRPVVVGDQWVDLQYWYSDSTEGWLARIAGDNVTRLLAYLALLRDPDPRPLLCIPEPENNLPPIFLRCFASAFSSYAQRRREIGQVMLTSNSRHLLNFVHSESVFCLVRKDGLTRFVRLADNPQIAALIQKGDQADGPRSQDSPEIVCE